MKHLLLIACFVITQQSLTGQIFLSLEFPNKAETIKYRPGQILHFKTKEYPKDWRKAEITRIDPEASVIFFKNDFIQLDEIIAVRRYNPWANYIGNGLYVFSSQWILIGGIAAIFLDYEPSIKDIIIPAVSLGIGYGFKKLFSKDTYIVGRNFRLRIIDLRMEVKD
jgi:hypothetical protein